MKKFIAIAVLAIASISASAQVYVGGSFGLSRNTTANETDFTILPEIGYGINPTWAVGTTIGYNYNYDDGIKTNVFAFKPYARYTFFRAANNHLSLFIDGEVGIGAGKSKYEDFDSDTVTIWSIGFKPGVEFSVTDHFGFNAHLSFIGYQGANDAAKLVGYNNEFGIDLSGMNLTFGFYYTF